MNDQLSGPSKDAGKRIVIVDDEAVIRMGLRRILEDAGHTVVAEAASGEEALRLVPEASPHLVILDIRVPEPNGIEIARRLKVEYPVPIVFLTAFSDRELLQDAADAGGYAYIIKPVNERAVLAAIEMVVARWHDLQAAKDALETRKLVERAKGILMRMLGLNEDDAYRLLHRRSRYLRKPMRDIARDILVADQVFRPSKAR
jgi:response regulator NasT